MAAASDGGLGCVAGAGQEAAGRCARIASHAWPSAASGALAAVCWSVVSVEKWGWSMFAALCAVHGDVGAVVRSRGGVSVSVRVQERVVAGLVRARCVLWCGVCAWPVIVWWSEGAGVGPWGRGEESFFHSLLV